MDAKEFRQLLKQKTDAEIVTEVLLAPGAKHVKDADIDHIRRRLAEAFSTGVDDVSVYIVGSAKLGFSISEKKLKDGAALAMFRSFRAASDIDIAVISPPIFDAIWTDLTRHAYSAVGDMLPWNSGYLGDYLVHGWLRPDHFPKNVRLRRCDAWWDLFRSLSREARFERHQVRGGLFHSLESLTQYYERGVAECRIRTELSL